MPHRSTLMPQDKIFNISFASAPVKRISLENHIEKNLINPPIYRFPLTEPLIHPYKIGKSFVKGSGVHVNPLFTCLMNSVVI